MEEKIQPSNDAVATKIAVAYDIARTCGKVSGDPTSVARLVGELVKIIWEAEEGKKE